MSKDKAPALSGVAHKPTTQDSQWPRWIRVGCSRCSWFDYVHTVDAVDYRPPLDCTPYASGYKDAAVTAVVNTANKLTPAEKERLAEQWVAEHGQPKPLGERPSPKPKPPGHGKMPGSEGK